MQLVLLDYRDRGEFSQTAGKKNRAFGASFVYLNFNLKPMRNNYNQGYNPTLRMYHSSCSIKNESDGGAKAYDYLEVH